MTKDVRHVLAADEGSTVRWSLRDLDGISLDIVAECDGVEQIVASFSKRNGRLTVISLADNMPEKMGIAVGEGNAIVVERA